MGGLIFRSLRYCCFCRPFVLFISPKGIQNDKKSQCMKAAMCVGRGNDLIHVYV